MLLTYLPETPELATKPLVLSTSVQDGSTFTSPIAKWFMKTKGVFFLKPHHSFDI